MRNRIINKYILAWIVIFFIGNGFNTDAKENGYLIKFQDGYIPNSAEYQLKEINGKNGIYSTEDIDLLKPIQEYIEHISINRKVSLIEGRETVTTYSIPEDEFSSEQWQLQLIHADAGWKLETYGNDIKVAVIDSGCYAHEDLKNNLLEGKNYLTGTTDVTDNNGHGTHVSGIIAAEMNDIGIVGVAPKAKIVPLKCFDPDYDTYVEDILDAIYDAVDVYGCKVINMSWGLKENDPFLQEAIDYADQKGVILVASVGNYSSTVLYYPAAYENVIGVSSVTIDKNKSSFAQYNKSVMVAASGEKVKSTYKDGAYHTLQGTSQAAPMVSGVAAVALSMDESLTAEQFRELLTETAEDLGDTGYDTKFGYGLVNESALAERIQKNKAYYVSPVNVRDGEAYVLIKNNTEFVMKAVSIFAEYDNEKYVKGRQTAITLLPDKEIIIKIKNEADVVKHFLWSGYDNMAPLTLKRKREEWKLCLRK